MSSALRSVGAGRAEGRVCRGTISERALRRCFRHAYGYGPKTLYRILRFGSYMDLARAGSKGGATLAASAGCADQSHLVRYVQRLSWTTPGRLGDMRSHSNAHGRFSEHDIANDDQTPPVTKCLKGEVDRASGPHGPLTCCIRIHLHVVITLGVHRRRSDASRAHMSRLSGDARVVSRVRTTSNCPVHSMRARQRGSRSRSATSPDRVPAPAR